MKTLPSYYVTIFSKMNVGALNSIIIKLKKNDLQHIFMFLEVCFIIFCQNEGYLEFSKVNYENGKRIWERYISNLRKWSSINKPTEEDWNAILKLFQNIKNGTINITFEEIEIEMKKEQLAGEYRLGVAPVPEKIM